MDVLDLTQEENKNRTNMMKTCKGIKGWFRGPERIPELHRIDGIRDQGMTFIWELRVKFLSTSEGQNVPYTKQG